MNKKNYLLDLNNSKKPFIIYKSDKGFDLYTDFSKKIILNNKNIKLTTLNNDCIVGFYLNTKELKDFINCKFYNPNKKDWLIKPHENVEWINYNDFKSLTKNYLKRKFSPLFWVK